MGLEKFIKIAQTKLDYSVFGYRFFQRKIPKFIQKINPKVQTTRKLLDIGCGDQPYRSFLNNLNYVGIDNNSEPNALLDEYGSINDLPFNDNSFDIALTVWVLDDVFELEEAFREVARVLKPGGYYYAVEVQSVQLHNPPHDYFRFTPNAMAQLARNNGFDMLNYESYGGDFALIGTTTILILRTMLSGLKIPMRLGAPVYFLINVLFGLLDWVFTQRFFKHKFSNNSIGYLYKMKVEK